MKCSGEGKTVPLRIPFWSRVEIRGFVRTLFTGHRNPKTVVRGFVITSLQLMIFTRFSYKVIIRFILADWLIQGLVSTKSASVATI